MTRPLTAADSLFDETLTTSKLKLLKQSQSENEFECLNQIFEQRVILTPDKPALVFKNSILTFSQLNKKANNLAAFLRANYRVMPEQILGIDLDRSEKMIIAILAILKAGAAYLPINPDAPAERKKFMYSDAGVKVVITETPPSDRSSFPGINFVDIKDKKIFAGNGDNLTQINHEENAAYVIFTSGSTGEPKGVIIEHKSAINFVNYNINRYKVDTNDTVLLLSSYFFDVSIWEIFTPLLAGGCLSILEPGFQQFPEKILAACEKSRVTLFFLTPVPLQLLLTHLEANPEDIKKLTTLRRLFTGGEVLTVKLANLFNKLIYRPLGAGLTNLYGPTEATVWVTVFDCDSKNDLEIVPIGSAISNTQIYILNSNGDLLPEGEIGELVIGGTPAGRGYLNRPELDQEKFVISPLSKGKKIYKTGDRARYLPDGNIEFLGRIDNQIKLNGYRIEPGEIEEQLLKNATIKECVVLARNINESNELVAYYTLTKQGVETPPKEGDLIAALKIKLPDFMVPSFFVELPSFPISINGKTDRAKLPLPVLRHAQMLSNYVAPSTETEKTIVNLLIDNLNIANIGVEDNLFDLGVRSLMITKIMLKLNSVLATQLTLPIFFRLPTVRQLARYVDSNHLENKNPFVLLRRGTDTPLFLLPGQHGDPLTFINFIYHYKIMQSIYSISYPPEDELDEFEDMQAYAKYLLKQIKSIQPSGPYNLLGFSLGGDLCFEMALQLQAQNESVGLLAMLSADAPLKKSKYLNHKALREFRFLLRPNLYLLKKYIKYRIPALVKKLTYKHPVNSTSGEAVTSIQKSNTSRMWQTYQSTLKYKGNLILFCEDVSKVKSANFKRIEVYTTFVMDRLWKNHVSGKIEKYKFTCLHGDFFTEPLVKNVAKIIEDYFKK